MHPSHHSSMKSFIIRLHSLTDKQNPILLNLRHALFEISGLRSKVKMRKIRRKQKEMLKLSDNVHRWIIHLHCVSNLHCVSISFDLEIVES